MRREHGDRELGPAIANGDSVPVPGWDERHGVSAEFVCDDDQVFVPLPGYVDE